jgi:hypothetical protein
MKLKIDQKDIFDKLFVLGFTWITPMSFLGIMRASIIWILVNGIKLPFIQYGDEDVFSTEESSVNEQGESSVNEQGDSESSSSPQVDESVASTPVN